MCCSASLHAPLASAEVFCVNVLGLGNRDVAAYDASAAEQSAACN